VFETDGASVDDLDRYIMQDRPEGIQARVQHSLHAAVHPHYGALVVLEVNDPRFVAQRPRPGDNVQVLVVEPHVTHRHDVHADLAQEVPDEMTARTQDALELAVLEQ
jgi:hypothetical protein